MPYYCTVPRCTSMAGKAKNVSFHQFPRDEDLAKLWNKILKRGKPYTKYSKVCSLHFTPEDYTITSGQKNKGQWRTLRKDAVPSRNLPTDSPVPYRRKNSSWTPPPTMINAQMQQQMAQAIYVQTMLAMQAASISALSTENSSPTEETDAQMSSPIPITSPLEHNKIGNNTHIENEPTNLEHYTNTHKYSTHRDTFKCEQCSKCFKDPDVYLLHKRSHTKSHTDNETGNTEEMLKANPILANLLRSNGPHTSKRNETNGVFDVKNVRSIENQIMSALTANMENYLRNLSTIMTHGNTDDVENGTDTDSKEDLISNCDKQDLYDSNLVIDEDN
ncbi:uncharacterized protein LOC126778715 [Nymphalis io]|uniref:uncharacterized protein LOC126778715 n=1 Tax=Inachis io TaxID=171585 RepID=UPI00216748EF|nr:uncharacterized protein LOC126778715 [Nymphalis io]